MVSRPRNLDVSSTFAWPNSARTGMNPIYLAAPAQAKCRPCFGLAASLALAFATAPLGGSALASVEKLAGTQIDPMQIMMSSKDLPAAHHDDYSLVFN